MATRNMTGAGNAPVPGNECGNRTNLPPSGSQDFLGHADPRMTAKYAHVVDMAKKNPALFIPVKVG